MVPDDLAFAIRASLSRRTTRQLVLLADERRSDQRLRLSSGLSGFLEFNSTTEQPFPVFLRSTTSEVPDILSCVRVLFYAKMNEMAGPAGFSFFHEAIGDHYESDRHFVEITSSNDSGSGNSSQDNVLTAVQEQVDPQKEHENADSGVDGGAQSGENAEEIEDPREERLRKEETRAERRRRQRSLGMLPFSGR